MARFMNKNELIIIILLLLVFDLNALCYITLPHILYKDQRNLMSFLLGLSFLIFDMIVFHIIVHSVPTPEIKFKNNHLHVKNLPTCKETVIEQTKNQYDNINKLKQICKNNTMDIGHLLSEEIVLNYIAIILILIIVSCTIIKGTRNEPNMNSNLVMGLYAIPLIIIIIGTLFFSNIYLNTNYLSNAYTHSN